MAITHFLLHSNLYLHPTKNSSLMKRNYSSCCIQTCPKFNIKCFMMNPKPEQVDTETGMSGVVLTSMENAIKASLQVTTGALLILLLLCGDQQALAASGGRMGGRSRSRSRSSSFRSSSARASYGSRSRASSSESYSTAIGNPAPISINPTHDKPSVSRLVSTLLACFVSFVIKEWADGELSELWHTLNNNNNTNNQGHANTTLLKLQVGSLGTGRLLQKDLNRIADSADTSTTNGLHSVLQDTILALLRHSEYCISGYSSVDVKKSVAECEKQFDQVSIEERGKFDEETLVNVNNIKKKTTTSQTSNGLPNEYIVVTIILSARGVLELPPIKSSEQLKQALQKLASIHSSNVVGAEVLWTPQKEDDSLTELEMLEDYPLLHAF